MTIASAYESAVEAADRYQTIDHAPAAVVRNLSGDSKDRARQPFYVVRACSSHAGLAVETDEIVYVSDQPRYPLGDGHPASVR